MCLPHWDVTRPSIETTSDAPQDQPQAGAIAAQARWERPERPVEADHLHPQAQVDQPISACRDRLGQPVAVDHSRGVRRRHRPSSEETSRTQRRLHTLAATSWTRPGHGLGLSTMNGSGRNPLVGEGWGSRSDDGAMRIEAPYWSRRWDSNPRPAAYEAAALPAELRRLGSPAHCIAAERAKPAPVRTTGTLPQRRGGGGRPPPRHQFTSR
jgi:hypothetical protein